MIAICAHRLTVPLALAAVLGLLAAASAQQSPPAKDAKPAAKSERPRRRKKSKRLPTPPPRPAARSRRCSASSATGAPIRRPPAARRSASRWPSRVLAGDRAAEPAARSGLHVRLDPAGREGEERDLDRDRLSVQAGLRGERRHRRRRSSRCTPRTTAPGSRTPPKRRAWSTPCARAPTWWSRRIRPRHQDRPTAIRSRALRQALDRVAQECQLRLAAGYSGRGRPHASR